MGLFNRHRDAPQIEFKGHQYTPDAFVAMLNQMTTQFDQARQQLTDLHQQVSDHQAAEQRLQDEKGRLEQQLAQLKKQLQDVQSNAEASDDEIEVGNTRMKVRVLADRYLESNRALADANDQLDTLSRELSAQKESNRQLKDEYNRKLAAYDGYAQQLEDQLAAATHVEIDGQKMTVTELVQHYQQLARQLSQAEKRYMKSNRALSDANNQLDRLNREHAAQEEANRRFKDEYNRKLGARDEYVRQLKDQLAEASHIEVNGQQMTVAELTQSYRWLTQQLLQKRTQLQSVSTQPTAPARSSVPSANQKLIDRYYALVRAVLAEYQQAVARLQAELTESLTDHHESEFLQLVSLHTSPTNYQRLLRERGQQLLNYIKDHPHQEKMLRHGERAANESAPVRGLNYWRGFVDQYQQAVAKLLEKNLNVQKNFQYALRYDKALAQRIAGDMPFYLSAQNVVDLHTIQDGISDEQTINRDIEVFRSNINASQKGAAGEQLVRDALQDYEHGRVMFSLNLPYQYADGKDNSNQIDGIVINEKGIFILEIKNYAGSKIWINRDGYAVTETADGRRNIHKDYHDRSIVDQGKDHCSAVLKAMKRDDEVSPHIRYLSDHVHVLYVSTNPHAKIVTTGAGVDPNHHFVSLAELQEVIDGANGKLRPGIIQLVAAAISNQQKGEKQFSYKCFPADPDRRVEQAWKQYTIMQKMLRLKLDDLVARRDPHIMRELDKAGLRSCNGFVNNKPRNKK
ncbi:NERD domain-containing protein [Limosilactobacillus pontis]|uniref:NERD domain-containing protein n=1 Tax=Limosilactobacillus pontis TaxID=35787 RepID=UPI0025A31A37|nr:NERD domain-containing protein [Limosilactobacillus pontis]MDM8332611.1 NERD domain-containing protein [Limosilactobacillus pontis]